MVSLFIGPVFRCYLIPGIPSLELAHISRGRESHLNHLSDRRLVRRLRDFCWSLIEFLLFWTRRREIAAHGDDKMKTRLAFVLEFSTEVTLKESID